jgi:hypothetical protein
MILGSRAGDAAAGIDRSSCQSGNVRVAGESPVHIRQRGRLVGAIVIREGYHFPVCALKAEIATQ